MPPLNDAVDARLSPSLIVFNYSLWRRHSGRTLLGIVKQARRITDYETIMEIQPSTRHSLDGDTLHSTLVRHPAQAYENPASDHGVHRYEGGSGGLLVATEGSPCQITPPFEDATITDPPRLG
ncbi:hypothetical protein DL771_000129 [Monosporascus sp. 5C6A]|nr:hypothetical protein DL771_000129 [Monosporascus sp. 5C6A]